MRRFDRRSFIKIGSIAPFGMLSWGDVLRATAAPKKDLSIIHLLLGGGMSHIDTFDLKPDLGAKYRSIFKPIPTNVSGLQVCEHLPLTAKQADKFTVIRSMTHKDGSHEGATDIMLTGHKPLPTMKHPSVGSVVTKELGPRNELPTYVSIPSARRREQSGFLGPQYNPFSAGDPNVEKYSVRDLELPMGVDWTQMESRYSLLRLVDSKISQWDTGNTFDSIDSYYESALGLMRSPLAKKAFDIAQEPETLREQYGHTGMGQGCLLARRLVEAGVRFVTIKRGNWDHHSNIFENLANDYLPEFDRAYATLLEDLHERGMLDSTIVLVTGEFGRTPEINVYTGRDHWPNCFSLTIGGGGIEGGRVWGASDSDARFVKDNSVEVPDFTATLYNKLGVDHTKEYMTNIGRPMVLSDGTPLSFL
jgi:hypothetical protein